MNKHNKMLHMKYEFANSFNKLKKDPSNINSYRRCGSYFINNENIKYEKNINYFISQGINKYSIEKILNPEDIFLNSIIQCLKNTMKKEFGITKYKCEIHQIRNIIYKDSKIIIQSTQNDDKYDFKVSPLIIKKYNIIDKNTELYNRNNQLIFSKNLKKYDYLLYNNKELYNLQKPLTYYLSDGLDDFGFQDELHINITKY